jgi:hypothetical protein
MRFAATVEMVQARIPHVRIDDTTEPSTAQVMDHIAEADNDVSLALGSLSGIDVTTQSTFLATVMDQAARLVATEAASRVWHAKFPEGAGPSDGKQFGTGLHKRFLDKLAELQATVNRGTGAPDGDVAPVAGPSWQAPVFDSAVLQQGRPLFVDLIDPHPDRPYAPLGSV